MKKSNLFMPLLKEDPSEAVAISHKLMLRAGMIRQQNSGIYSWLPLGLKVLNNIEKIIRKNLDMAGLIEILMPCIQPASLWKESGRYEAYGKEMLKIQDRHNNDMLFGPTNEEVMTDIARRDIMSYKDLPKNFYQLQWKFRDEIRPRFGVMRGREFLMKDAYSFDLEGDSLKKTYELMFKTYFKIFKELGVNVVSVKAENGAIGGDLSHEFHVLAETGESEIFYDKKYDDICSEMMNSGEINIGKINEVYAAADEMHDPSTCPVNEDDLCRKRGIEVGHIFSFGQKYSQMMEFSVMGPEGKPIFPHMGSYGIGVSRLVAAIIESSFDEKGIIWPKEVAPFDVQIICLKPQDEECLKLSEKVYEALSLKGLKVLLDDSKDSIGAKFASADLIGMPKHVVIGPKLMKDDLIEIKDRKTGDVIKMKISEILKDEFVKLMDIL